MKILYDYQAFCRNSYGGVSRYYAEIISVLKNMNIDVNILAPFHRNYHINDIDSDILGFFCKKYPPKTTKFFLALNYISSVVLSKFINFDILHETYYSNSPICSSKTRVLTVYDCIHELLGFDKSSPELVAKKRSIERADHIICISNNTKNDLMNYYNFDENRITVIHCGVSESVIFDSSKLKIVFNNHKPFILYVGTRFQYKRFMTLIDAISIDKKILKEFNIVLFGGGDLSYSEKNYISSKNLDLSNFIYLSGDDNLLAYLYRHARLLAYTSEYEGFGFPPVDAMRNHCPVVVSNSSCLPEIGGNGVSYFDPGNAESLLDALRLNLYDDFYRDEISKLGYQQSLKYSWEKCAIETLDLYQKLL